MILEVGGVSFTYQSCSVLENVHFSVGQGDLLAILGPNGVGKTTLLKCINAMLRPQEGTVFVEQEDVLKLRPSDIARRIGYVAQNSETSRLSVFDAVLMGRRPYIRWKASPKDISIVDAALKRLGLEDLALRYIDQLSGGEFQKVCIARALVQDPILMLLDEPTSSLDLKNQIEILSLIRRVITEHDVAAVMTMHDINTALRYAHKILFMKNGSVFAVCKTSEVSADMVEAVYGVPVLMHQVDGVPLVVPLDNDRDHPSEHAHEHLKKHNINH